MKHALAIAGLLTILLAFTARAAGPEDQYIAIYYLMQQADAASAAGNNVEAAERYTDARDSLQQLQRAYPAWQTNVVGFRLNYLATRIAALDAGKPVAKSAPIAAPAPRPANPVEDSQLTALQAQLQQLQASNASLEAKLREALSVRPAAADPRDLARAEQQIKELARENDLLKASLNDAQAKAAATTNAKQAAALRKELDEANRKLASEAARTKALTREKGDLQDQLDRVIGSPRDNGSSRATKRKLDETAKKLAGQEAVASQLVREKSELEAKLKTLEVVAANAVALQAENAMLRKQVAELRAAPPSGDQNANLGRRLAAAEAQIAALQSERDILRLERTALEGRVKQLMAAAPRTEEAQRIKQLERERDALEEKLAKAGKELAERKSSRSTAKADEIAAQLAALRAKLDVYEAKTVPYSAEELALFRQSPAKLAATDQAARKSSSIPKPPSGSGALIAEAQRHFARGDYAQAEQKYEQVLRKESGNVYTLANLAAIQLEEGKFDEAEKNLKQALALAPDDAYSMQTMGYLKFRQEKFDDALTFLSQAAQLNPDSAEIQNFLGVTLSHKGQRQAAESALRRAIILEPGYAGAHNNLAVIYATQENPSIPLARWHYQKAIAAGHPKNPALEQLLDKKEGAAAVPAAAP
jgi:Flp pilus assembly protein TadD